MLFAVTCLDKPDGLDLRLATRETHLAYLKDCAEAVRIAGPLLDERGDPIGSLLIVEAADAAAAEALMAGDPYARAGLFQSVEIRPWRWVIGAPEA